VMYLVAAMGVGVCDGFGGLGWDVFGYKEGKGWGVVVEQGVVKGYWMCVGVLDDGHGRDCGGYVVVYG
ncbi:hypothetical protein U1Q18_025424, partial [Sarracenia purpurea var. burkii]